MRAPSDAELLSEVGTVATFPGFTSEERLRRLRELLGTAPEPRRYTKEYYRGELAKRDAGARRSRSLAFHKAGAPWPTCSCPHCRVARRWDAERTGTLQTVVQRIRARREQLESRGDR